MPDPSVAGCWASYSRTRPPAVRRTAGGALPRRAHARESKRKVAAFPRRETTLSRGGSLFGTDHTHTNKAGAVINAESFVEGLKQQPNVALNNYLKK